mmetsp:Transcript_124008/g.215008  ORF Transcript_124008/g.215008 Transcript_124008/m.215008 type:complete len:127 (-) Transcript_124008:1171-1551(-)
MPHRHVMTGQRNLTLNRQCQAPPSPSAKRQTSVPGCHQDDDSNKGCACSILESSTVHICTQPSNQARSCHGAAHAHRGSDDINVHTVVQTELPSLDRMCLRGHMHWGRSPGVPLKWMMSRKTGDST